MTDADAAHRCGNTQMAQVWNGPAGDHRLRFPDQDDAEVRLHNERFRAATGIVAGDRVLDVGCGTGQTTRDAGRAAAGGRVLGVDLSSGMLDRARELTALDGLRNVSYEQADAQVHPFEPASFDVAISRFGVMFFADPLAAFANIGGALRPGGRLVLMVWQGRDRNEWASAIRDALTGAPMRSECREAPMAATPRTDSADVPEARGSADPFSLGDPARVRATLADAGFTDVDLADIDEPVYYGRDADAASDFVLGLWSTRTTLAALDSSEASRATRRLRAMLAAHDTGSGVFLDSRAWIVTARRHP
jgi:ubiquinone/menaquinone biosynthesis C-methylase UbiE